MTKKLGCASCGGTHKKMQKGGNITSKDLKDKDFSSKLYTKDGKIKSQAKIDKSNNSMKKMAKGGSTLSGSAIKKAPVRLYGIPQENMGTSGQYGSMQKGGAVKPKLKPLNGNPAIILKGKPNTGPKPKITLSKGKVGGVTKRK